MKRGNEQMNKVRKQMLEMAGNDVTVYANELVELRRERKELVQELVLKGECEISNKEVRNLDDMIESVETTIEMAMQYIRNATKEEQPN